MSEKINEMIKQVHQDFDNAVPFKVGMKNFTDLLREFMREIDEKLNKYREKQYQD